MIIGVDIGNASTEVAVGEVIKGQLEFITSAIVPTTGTKGTNENIPGIEKAIKIALKNKDLKMSDIERILINEATPVIGDFAMETITETVITESSLIGHNPDTPGGHGIGFGKTVLIKDLVDMSKSNKYIVLVPQDINFIDASQLINEAYGKGYKIEGLIVQKDEGVLINNRIEFKIPIIDEVKHIENVPLGMDSAIEVALPGFTIDLLSNPYGIATSFNLTSKETQFIIPVAKSLIGNRSAVVIRTPKGNIQERKIKAGKIIIQSEMKSINVDIDSGSNVIMEAIQNVNEIIDINGEPGTNVAGMIGQIKNELANLTSLTPSQVNIKDLFAVDTLVQQSVTGSLSGEFSYESAVGIAAMVKTEKLLMEDIANNLSEKLNVQVEVGGVEGKMAILGALTTPGTDIPIAVIDIGAGSTDASYMTKSNEVKSVHLAGAGNMVTMLINSELGLNDPNLAEDIKKYPVAKVESLFHIRHESGEIEFFQEPIDANCYARVVVLKDKQFIPIPKNTTIEKVRNVRREVKQKVLIKNSLRALRKLSPTGSLRDFSNIVLVGGSALDFEVPNMMTEVLSKYRVTAGKGNICGTDGPRNAVATGLLINHKGEYSIEQ